MTVLPPSSGYRRVGRTRDRNRPDPRELRRQALRRASSRVAAAVSRRSARFLNAPRPKYSIRFRLLLVWGVLMLGVLGLAVNLFRLQVLQANVLHERALQQQVVALRPFLPRRPIVDRNGTVLAIDQPVYTLYVHPVMFKETPQAIATQLAPILERPMQEVLAQFAAAESGIRLQDGLTEAVAQRVSQLGLDGLELQQSQQRLYPQQELFGTVLGYVDVDRVGQAGIENSQATVLEQSIDTVQLSRTGDGSMLPTGLPEALFLPDDLELQLTLDSDLQRVARFSLQRQIKQFNAKRGAVLVMDAWDGSVLALASEPSYDPNRYYEAEVDRFKNWVLSDVYEPGSTFKPINVAIALETNSISADEYFEDPGHIEVGGWPIENFDYEDYGGRGAVSVTDIIKNSSNVGMVRIMQRLKPSLYYEWLEKLGLGEVTGIDLPFESAGQMKSRKQFTGAAIEPATTAFGQGFSLTPIQLIQLHATLANGGKLVVPHVVQGLVNPKGQFEWQPDRPAPKPIFSPDTAQTVLQMMETVVSEGTGKIAQVPGYRIAGKTGTAQKASLNGGYLDGVKITSFVATFPVEKPRYVVLSVVDEPKGIDAFGSTVSAPVVKTMIETLIKLEKIPPSDGTVPGPIAAAMP